MKHIVTVMALAFSLAVVPVAFGAEGYRLGSVDIQKVLLLSDSGKEAREQLSSMGSKYEGEKNSREEELKKLKSELENQSALLSESARNGKEKDYQQKLTVYQRFLKDAQDNFKEKNEALSNKIVDEIVTTIQEFGKNNSYSYIFVRNNSMVYLDANVDLTDEVLKIFNLKFSPKKASL